MLYLKLDGVLFVCRYINPFLSLLINSKQKGLNGFCRVF